MHEKGEAKMATLDMDSKEHYKKPFNFEEAEKQGFTRKTLFETEHMRFSVYMILPGQENPLHSHPGSDEILAFTYGEGECVVGDEVVPVESGSVLFIPKEVPHAVRNTHESDILACTVVTQSPLPCEHLMMG
jgi:mannose-6-phosphate isomerase-like protein (cupin superfamily)